MKNTSQEEFLRILNNVSDWKNVELEIRYINITQDFIRSIIEDINDNYKISQSISFVKDKSRDSALVNNIEFLPNNKLEKTNYMKTVMSSSTINNRKFALSKEIETKEILASNDINFKARYKIRLSYQPEDSDWVYDITLVHNFINIENNTIFNEIKKQLYIENITKADMIKLLDNPLINKYEVEIEYKGTSEIDEINLKELEIRIPTLIEYSVYMVIINQLSELLKRKYYSFKTFLPQAVTLTSLTYNYLYPPVNWYLTHKTDGYRAIAYISDNIIVIGCANYFKTYYCKNSKCDRLSEEINKEINEEINEEISKDYYILDCELIDNNVYIFDILAYKSEVLVDEPFDIRYKYLEKLDLSHIESELSFNIKYFRQITNDLQRSFKDIIDYKPDYNFDGYMLISNDKTYTKTTSYKIKEYNTIDFYMLRCPEQYLDKLNFIRKKGYILYILYLTISKRDAGLYKIRPLDVTLKYFGKLKHEQIPVHFSPNDYPNAYIYYSKHDLGNNTIAELNPKFSEDAFLGWEFIKIREDKLMEPNYYGNYYTLAEEMWYANQNPLNINTMHLPADSYFSVKKDSAYVGQTAFNSFVKEHLILENKNFRAVCDLACGKGQDLGKYLKLGYKNIMLLEVDKNALAELIKRLPTTIKKFGNKESVGTGNIKIVNTNLHNNYEEIINKMRNITALKTYSLVVCNFAIHYVVDTSLHMLNFAKLLSEIVDPKGMFIYTTNHNENIHNKFVESGENEIVLYENGALKYQIKKDYDGNILNENLPQTVEWKLLFNNNLIPENLMPHNKFNEVMKEFGFSVHKEGSFSDYIDKFKPKEGISISDIDKEYFNYYYYCILIRA